MVADDPEDPGAIRLAGQGHVEASGHEFEQAWQQGGIVDISAVRGVEVTARAGVNADAGAVRGRKSRQREVVEIDEPVKQLALTDRA